jgi:tetratricopeptide (TPR) repeat protein
MTGQWTERVDEFWRTADGRDDEAVLDAMRELVAERPDGDPDALFEWASAHDFLGREGDAIPLYREALDRGLSGTRRTQAEIQLASSLCNVGRAEEAARLLEAVRPDPAVGDAPRAFLALALHDLGQHDRALAIALDALAATLPQYSRAVSAYAAELPDVVPPPSDDGP